MSPSVSISRLSSVIPRTAHCATYPTIMQALSAASRCSCGLANRFANPQEHLLAALNACMMVGYVAQCAVRGITLESLEIQTDGDIDLRGFLGVDPTVPPGYENLSYIVRIKGSGTKEDFAEIHDAVMATSPNFYN